MIPYPIMSIQVIPYSPEHIEACLAIWNEVVRDGIAFPQEDELTAESGHAFFSMQTFTGLARHEETGEITGLYILHPNNVGRCGHICNASYAVLQNGEGITSGRHLSAIPSIRESNADSAFCNSMPSSGRTKTH